MSIVLPKFEACFTAVASTYGLKVDSGSNAYLSAGSYYWTYGDNSVDYSLRAALQTLVAGLVGSSTVTISASGLMTITFGSGTHTITWASTTLRDLCGFAGNCSPAAGSFTGTKQVKRLWLPNHPPSDYDGSNASLGKRMTDRQVVKMVDGTPYVRCAHTWHERTFSFKALSKAKVFVDDEVTANESFEAFLRDALENGDTFRHYTDATDDDSCLTPAGSKRDYVLGEIEFEPTRRGTTDACWDLSFPGVHV